MGNLKKKQKPKHKMKFSALIATAAAAKLHKHQGLSLAQMKAAVGQDEYSAEEVFHWFDRDGSGAIDIYEFIFGIGWICGYYEYEPTEEDIMMLEQFWWDCDTDQNGELSLEECEAYAMENGY